MAQKETGDFIDSFLGDPALCRLYSALSALDPDTAEQIRKDMPAQKAKAYAHVLDFFGGMFEIRGGKVNPPGGARSEKAWADLVGVPPERGPAFIERLFAKDDGWLASYYDALARINGPVQDYLTEPDHLKRFYTALRGRVTSPGPARPVFRSSTDLVLLTARLRLNPDGTASSARRPGRLEEHVREQGHGQVRSQAGQGGSRLEGARRSDRSAVRPGQENGRQRAAENFHGADRRGAQSREAAAKRRPSTRWCAIIGCSVRSIALFSDVPTVTDATIVAFLDAARANAQMKDLGLRGDAAGTMQALTAFWQIFVRQGNIAPADADGALADGASPLREDSEVSATSSMPGRKGVRASARRRTCARHRFAAGSYSRSSGRHQTHRRPPIFPTPSSRCCRT